MELMENPRLLWRAVGIWTGGLTLLGFGLCWSLRLEGTAWGLLIGVATLSGVVGYYALLVTLLRRVWRQLFPLFLLAKYPLMMLVVYSVVQGGISMVAGFAVGVILPLAVLTGLAIGALVRSRG